MLRSRLLARLLTEGALASPLVSPGIGQSVRRAAAKPKKQVKKQAAKGKKGAPAASKKSKLRMETKPFDDQDPLNQRIVALLAPKSPGPRAPAASTPAGAPPQEDEGLEALQRSKEYSRRKWAEYIAWRKDLHTKLQLKREALAALPPDLRAHALVEDTEPFPLTRHFLYDSPPEGYRDP